MKTTAESIIGKVFGKLTVIGRSGVLHGKTMMKCTCSCGKSTEATIGHLTGGRRVSCGCSKDGNPTHGMRHTRTYSIWSDMLKRCTNPKSVSYKWYGAKGVSVCERWALFQNFLDDMGECPAGLSIDRIDNSIGYEPTNCRWATAQQQVENRDVQKLYAYQGREQTLPNWCREL